MLKVKQQEQNSKVVKKRMAVKYVIERDDIMLLNGKYQGHRIRELFVRGPNERDYVAEYLWSLNDPKINDIIRSMLCG